MSTRKQWEQIMAAKVAIMPLPRARDLLDKVATSIAGNEQDIADPHGFYVARHLSALMDRLDLLQADAEVMAGALPSEEPHVQLAREMYMAKTAMRMEFGDPQLRGLDTSLNPDRLPGGLEAAYYAQEAAGIVERHIGAVFAVL